jgi:hypothetical protein
MAACATAVSSPRTKTTTVRGDEAESYCTMHRCARACRPSYRAHECIAAASSGALMGWSWAGDSASRTQRAGAAVNGRDGCRENLETVEREREAESADAGMLLLSETRREELRCWKEPRRWSGESGKRGKVWDGCLLWPSSPCRCLVSDSGCGILHLLLRTQHHVLPGRSLSRSVADVYDILWDLQLPRVLRRKLLPQGLWRRRQRPARPHRRLPPHRTRTLQRAHTIPKRLPRTRSVPIARSIA